MHGRGVAGGRHLGEPQLFLRGGAVVGWTRLARAEVAAEWTRSARAEVAIRVYLIDKLKISEVADKRKYRIYRNSIGDREIFSDKI